MTPMTRLCVSIVLSLVVLPQFVPMSGAEGPACDLSSFLKRFPAYHLLTLQERDAATKAFIQRHYPEENPSLVRADFNDDGDRDCALVLKNDKSATTKLVVFLCVNGIGKSVYDLDLTGYSEFVYLRPIRRGSRVSQTEAISNSENTPPVKLQSSGVEIKYFGKATVVLYWDPELKRMKEIQTAD